MTSVAPAGAAAGNALSTPSSTAFNAMFHSGALILAVNVALRADLKARRLRDEQRDVMLSVVKLLKMVRAVSASSGMTPAVSARTALVAGVQCQDRHTARRGGDHALFAACARRGVCIM